MLACVHGTFYNRMDQHRTWCYNHCFQDFYSRTRSLRSDHSKEKCLGNVSHWANEDYISLVLSGHVIKAKNKLLWIIYKPSPCNSNVA